jgi:hypothetical protein
MRFRARAPGHWLETIGFAVVPLTVIAGIAALAIIERRRS